MVTVLRGCDARNRTIGKLLSNAFKAQREMNMRQAKAFAGAISESHETLGVKRCGSVFEPVRILGCNQLRPSLADVNRKNIKERGQPDTEPTGPRSGIRGAQCPATSLPGHGKLLHS